MHQRNYISYNITHTIAVAGGSGGQTSRFNIEPITAWWRTFFLFSSFPFYFLLLHQQLPAFSFSFSEYTFTFIIREFPFSVFPMSVTFSLFASIVIQTFFLHVVFEIERHRVGFLCKTPLRIIYNIYNIKI